MYLFEDERRREKINKIKNNQFYQPINSLLVRMEYVFKHLDLQVFGYTIQ